LILVGVVDRVPDIARDLVETDRIVLRMVDRRRLHRNLWRGERGLRARDCNQRQRGYESQYLAHRALPFYAILVRNCDGCQLIRCYRGDSTAPGRFRVPPCFMRRTGRSRYKPACATHSSSSTSMARSPTASRGFAATSMTWRTASAFAASKRRTRNC